MVDIVCFDGCIIKVVLVTLTTKKNNVTLIILDYINLLKNIYCLPSYNWDTILNNQNESFISMDIVGERGGDRIPFRWDARLSVARSIARALEYLHLNTKSQSIVPHGNLKSSNVLFDENDKVLVSDYGLASLLVLPIAIQHIMVSYKSP